MARPVKYNDGKTATQRAHDKLVESGGKRFGLHLSGTAVRQLEELQDLLPTYSQKEIFEYALSGLLRDLTLVDERDLGSSIEARGATQEAFVA